MHAQKIQANRVHVPKVEPKQQKPDVDKKIKVVNKAQLEKKDNKPKAIDNKVKVVKNSAPKKVNVITNEPKAIENPAPQKIAEIVNFGEIREMKTEQDMELIRKVAREWEKAASGKIKYFAKEKEKLQVAKDSQEVAERIHALVTGEKGFNAFYPPVYTPKSIKEGKFAIYAAFDDRKEPRMQGLALVNLEGTIHHEMELDLIMTNPERLKSIGRRPPISGTGTRLIQEVGRRALSAKKQLGLISLESSKPFYEKLGFKYDASEFGGAEGEYGMAITEENLKALVAMKV